jgi:hypothetical protein
MSVSVHDIEITQKSIKKACRVAIGRQIYSEADSDNWRIVTGAKQQ